MKEIYSTPAFRIMEIAFQAGKNMSRHHSSTDAFIIVTNGSADLKIDGSVIHLHRGVTQRIPAFKPHELLVVSDFTACLILEQKTIIKFLPPENKRDLETMEDVRLLIETFYQKVHKDELLAPIFNRIIGNNWPKHLDTMCRFWNTVLLGNHSYFGNPFSKHIGLPISPVHFDRWLHLFHETIDGIFNGNTAEEAKSRSKKMAFLFETKLDQARQTSITIL